MDVACNVDIVVMNSYSRFGQKQCPMQTESFRLSYLSSRNIARMLKVILPGKPCTCAFSLLCRILAGLRGRAKKRGIYKAIPGLEYNYACY